MDPDPHMMFKDKNLKLSVLSALMEEGHYVAEAERLQAAHAAGVADYTPVPEVMAYYASIEIPDAQLASITSLQPDGGDLAYMNAMIVWDGEDEQFDISSLEGIEHLVNLEVFAPIAMMAEDGVDYRPLLGCKKLKRVDMSFATTTPDQDAVAEELVRRGVEVEH